MAMMPTRLSAGIVGGGGNRFPYLGEEATDA
jgi:hypothetical protein